MFDERWMRRVAGTFAWTLAAGLVFVTWCPQSLRPHLGDANLERFGAFFLTSAMFVLAYPRRAGVIAICSTAFAIILELGQLFVPGRDAGVVDAIAKALGGLAGVTVCYFALRVLEARRG
jgi:VanZ family protein